MVVIGHVELPEGTVCPLTNLPLRPEGIKPRVTIRTGGGGELSCPNCTKKRHYPPSFQETNPEICKLIADETAILRREYKERKQQQEQEEEQEDEDEDEDEDDIIENEDLNEEQNILDKQIYDAIYEYKKQCSIIAEKYQSKVDKSPRKNQTSKDKKELERPMIKNFVWKSYFPNITQTNCPVCSQNAISFDNYSLGHIHPKSRYGTNTPNNLIPICSTCNTLMGTQHLYSYAWNVYSKVLW
jgi:5-methylcytosine-specific restriction endonuclease McrA